VLGAGATGLAAAYTLVRQGRKVRLFDASDRYGGAVQSERENGWLIEAGPNSMQESSTELTALIAELGLEPHKRYAQPEAKNRYILRGGRPVAAPTSPPGFLSSPLFSAGAKVRLFAELLQRRRVRTADVSLAEFVASHFGQELVDYGLNPFVSGVYAGDATKLSAKFSFPTLWAAERTHGSLIRAQIAAAKEKKAKGERRGPAPIISFSDGLAMLTRALASRLPDGTLELEARVETLVQDGAWKLVWSRDGQTRTETFSRVLLALPASALARLTVGPLGERPLAELDSIDYPPVASLFLGYRREQVQHPLDGFGVLVPQREHRQVLGVLFSSSLFPGRAPDGHVAVTVMMGGLMRPDLGRAPLADLLPIAAKELAELLGVQGEPVFLRHHAWPKAIPQYNLGYGRFLDAMTRCEQGHPGLLIGGHVRDGIALPACLAAGQRLAERAIA
jgi:protoporphyrinogen/coproporphyrinogen III oxidase